MFVYRPIRTVSNFAVGGPGSAVTLGTVNVDTAAASAVLKIYDGTSASGTLVASIDASAKGSYTYLTRLPNGMFVDLSGGTADCTIGYA